VPRPLRVQGNLRFGEDFELDLRAHELRRGGIPIKLERIPMQVLLLLIEHRNELVTRDQIVERVWGNSVFIDSDNSLNGAIRKIRRVLKDDPERPRFLQTITGLGYRFIAPLDEHEDDSDAGNSLNSEIPLMQPPRPQSVTNRSPRQLWWLAAFGSAVLLMIAGGWLGWSRFGSSSGHAGKVMLAVLPLQNLTGDSSQDYFSDGMTEEMITQLGNLDPEHLGVIARTSVMHFKNSKAGLDQIERELGVQYVVEGSVRRDNNSVRVTAQLIRMKDQTHVWARQYDRQLVGVLSLQSEIAQEVADEIHLTLEHKSPAAHPPSTPQNYAAYDLYLKGQYFLNKRTLSDLQQSIVYFEQATLEDRTYARAYAGMAAACALLPGYSGQSQGELINKARTAAMMSLKLDESLPEAHTALALIVQNYDWDWQTAEKEFRRAIELNPNYATAHHWYAEHLMWRGRFEDAFKESEYARELDPLSLIIASDNGAILYFSRQYDRAIEKWNSVLAMDPYFVRAGLIKAAYIEKGDLAEALDHAEKQRPRDVLASYWAWRAYTYGRFGQMPQARRALQELLQIARKQSVDPMLLTRAYLGVRSEDEALLNLEKAYLQHSNELVALKVDPAYDPLRRDARFKDLLRRVGLE
jgi:TolB-like protein/DNA-binding winged helix-turn-helix (wHTH) protein/Flp pilus assembly protein TadD